MISIESIDLNTIKVEVFLDEESKKVCLIVLDGFIDNANTGGKVYDIVYRYRNKGRSRIIIDCGKLAYFAHSAGGLAFLGIAKSLQHDGIKVVLLNMNNVYLHDTFMNFFTFIDLPCIDLQNYWNEIEKITNDDSAFTYEDAKFPVKVNCPICGKEIDIKNEGKILCTECNINLSINKKGVIIIDVKKI